MTYDNTDKGVLFKNDRKERDTHPDYRGTINVGGVEYWLSAWIKTGQRGKFMSLSLKPKEDQPRRQEPQSISQRAMPKGPARDRITTGPQKQNIIPDDDMGGDSIPF